MYKFKIYINVFLLFVFLSNYAQQINKAEYYWDTDPGVGNGINVPVTAGDSISKNLSISVSGLSLGAHRLYIRARNTAGKWSIADSRPISITALSSSVPQISQAEYFIDNDPGVGNGVSVSNITTADSILKSVSINATGLSIGMHRVYLRVRNNAGVWSIADGRSFVVTGFSASIPQITKAEYFIDTDPGVGNGTAITGIVASDSISKNLNINISSLSIGLHRLYIRVRNSSGTWSIADSRPFTVTPSTTVAVPQISKAEYFIDTDPGQGNGIAISGISTGDSISKNFSINVNSLSAGIHRVYIRVKNTSGVWSIADSRSFSVVGNSLSATNKRRIKRAEYFFDNDPGHGNGISINTGSFADSISISNLQIPVSSLSLGTHKVFVRVVDSTGVWSIAQGVSFMNCAQVTYPAFTYSNGCTGTVINFNNTSTGNGSASAAYSWSFGDNGLSNSTSPTHIYSSPGNYNITLIASNGAGCADTLIQQISIGQTPNANAISISSGSQATTFCQGNNALLTANSSLSNITYQWQNNSVDIAGETNIQYNAISTGSYRCKISNGCGVAYSNAISIVVNTFPIITVTPPNNAIICQGSNGTFTATVSGATSQNWFLDGQPISGATSNTYIASSSGDYYFSASNSCGSSQSSVYNLSIVPNAPASVSITSSNTTICPGDQITFTAVPLYGGSNPTYQWKKNGVNINGATLGTYNTSSAANNDLFSVTMVSNETCVTNANANSNSIQVFVTNSVNASVTITSTSTSICAGQTISFTANPIGGGSNPTFQWKLNGSNITGATASTYSSSNFSNGDLISVVMTSSSGCALGSPASSAQMSISVGTAATASVSILPASSVICEGTLVTFTATAVNGGSLAAYQWKLNGVDILGANSSTYSSANLSNGDNISCVLTSSLACVTGSPAISNNASMIVNPNQILTASIAADTINICSGTVVHFTSSVVNGGTSTTYQWKKNGVNISGATGPTFNTSNIADNDIFSLQVYSNATCVVSSPVISSTITMHVGQTVAADVSINATSTTICPGQLVTFTAVPVGGGNSPNYQWYLNGNLVPGISSSTYSNASLINGDQVAVTMTSNASCTSGSPVTSAPVIITVSNAVNAGLSITSDTTSICAGTQVTFTANPINGGINPSFQWKKNGVNISGAIASTYSTGNINNLDDFTCEMISSSTCAVGGAVVSNDIVIQVTQIINASVVASTATSNVCTGSTVNLFAIPASGLNNISYQWSINGVPVASAQNQIFSISNIQNNELVKVELNSTDHCVTGLPASSNVVTLLVNQPVQASVAIVATDSTVCSGTPVTFTAFATNGGTSPQYQWFINGVSVAGQTNSTFTSGNIPNGSIVTAQLISNAICVTGSPSISPGITLVSTACANAIGTGSIAGSPFCNNFTFLVPFTSAGTYASGNVYTAQLSDANGNFNNPVNIGALASTSLIGQIICTIPSNIAAGTGYRIRVVSSLPATIGTDNGANLSVINSNFSLDFTASTTSPSAPFVVSFTNNTPNAGDYNFVWYFGDGSLYAGVTPPTHIYPHNGLYSVSLLAIKILTGCTDTLVKSNYINCQNGPINCNFDVNVNPGGPINACLGGTVDLTCTTNAVNPTYQWNINGVTIGGETQATIHASVSGYYSVTVYSNGSCPVTTNLLAVNFNNTAPQAPIVTSSGNILACSGGSQTLTASAGYANYLWSNGATTQSIQVSNSGYYYVYGSNGLNDGCASQSNIVTVNASNVTVPEICMVTVDTVINKNVIVWEKPLAYDIDSFIVFKETYQAGIYKRIGGTRYSDLSEFVDTTSRPKVHADRYKLAALDTCGGLTLPSAFHKTMHLQINPGVGYDRNLSWSHEEGIPFSTYEIFRKKLGQNFWTKIDSVQSTINTYTDIAVDTMPARYQVQVKLPGNGCNSSKSSMTAKIKSTSNSSSNAEKPIPFGVGFKDLNNSTTIHLSPNPSNGKVNLNASNILSNAKVHVYDLTGKLLTIYTWNSGKSNMELNLENFDSGVYFVSIIDGQSRFVSKLIIEH
jgi:PKD repeat protein